MYSYRINIRAALSNVGGKLEMIILCLAQRERVSACMPLEVRDCSTSDSGGKGILCLCHRRKRITVQIMLRGKD